MKQGSPDKQFFKPSLYYGMLAVPSPLWGPWASVCSLDHSPHSETIALATFKLVHTHPDSVHTHPDGVTHFLCAIDALIVHP